jgi:uncharacterized protein YjbI with pentapeptide repeats
MFGLRRAYRRYWEKQRKQSIESNAWLEANMDAILERAAEANPLLTKAQFPRPPEVGCQHRLLIGGFCGRAQLAESRFCFWHDRRKEKYSPSVISTYFGKDITLRDAMEQEVAAGRTLAGAYLEDAALGGNWFQRGADLSNADLRGADLRGMHLSYGSLQNANLTFANLEEAYLSDVAFGGAQFTRARLYRAKLRNNDLSSVRGLDKNCFRNRGKGILPRYSILEDHPDQAEPMYRELTAYFSRIGALDDASWAAYRCRIMRHRILRKRLSFSTNIIEASVDDSSRYAPYDPQRVFEVGLSAWLSNLLEFVKSSIYWLLFGYGEKPFRVGILSAVVMTMYAALYAGFGALTEHGFGAALYFSVVTFTTLGYGDVTAVRTFRLMAASEAVVGLLFTGLFLFALSRRAIGRA